MIRPLLIALTLALAACTGAEQKADAKKEAEHQLLIDERDIRNVAAELDRAVDAKEWDKARALFTDQVEADFSSLAAGGSPGTISADSMIEQWRLNLYPGKESRRLRSGERITINGDTATMTSRGQVRLTIPSRTTMNTWLGEGVFEHKFTRTPEGWRISGFKFTLEREEGTTNVRTETAPPEPAAIDSARCGAVQEGIPQPKGCGD